MKRLADKTHGALIQKCHLFANIEKNLAHELSAHFKQVTWDKNSHIDQDTLKNNFFFLIQGRIEMMRINPDTGRSVTLDLLHPWDGLDIVTLLDGKPHEMFFSPVEELRLISVPIEKMRGWIWKYPELNETFMPYIAQKLRNQEDKTTDFALHDTVTRLSRILLKNLDNKSTYTGKPKDEHKHHLITGLSDEMLARMVGSVRQVINQHLQHWKQDGIINKARNKIRINDLQGLYNKAGVTLSRY